VRQVELEDVQIKHLALPGGISLRAGGLDLRWSGTASGAIGAAVLQVDSFTFSAPGVQPITGGVSAWGKKSAKGWQIGRLRAHGEGWQIDGSANAADGTITAQGRTEVELAGLERTLSLGAGLEGDVTAQFHASFGRDGFHIDAKVAGPRVSVAGFPFDDIAGEAHISSEGLDASLTHAGFAGGNFEGSYRLAGFGPPWRHEIAVRGEGVSLAGFLHRINVNDAGLAATFSTNAEVTWDGRDLMGGAGTAIADLKAGDGDVPVRGHVVVALAHDGALQIDAKKVTLAGAPVRWEGRLSIGTWRPDWHIDGVNVPIPAIARLLRGWIGVDVVPAQLQGEAVVDLGLWGEFSNLHASGSVALAPVSFGPVEADGLEASFRIGNGVLAVESGEIAVDSGRITGAGELRYGAGNALRLHLVGKGIPLARMVAWGGVRAPWAGKVDFTGTLEGSLAAPRGEARLALRSVAIAGVELGAGRGRVTLADGVVDVGALKVGPFSASSRLDLTRRQAVVDAALTGFGLEGISPPLARLVGGALDCTLHGEFPFDTPSGRLQLTSAQGARGEVELTSRTLRVDLVRPKAWRVAGELQRAGREFHGKLQFGIESWRLLTADLGGAVPVDGTMSGEAELRLAPPKPAILDGVIDHLELDVEPEHAALSAPARFHVEGGAITIPGATLVGPGSSLAVRGGRKADGTLYGHVAGEVPAALLGLFWRQARPAGRVELLGEISGTDTAPRFEGNAKVTGGALHLPGLPGPLTRISGDVELNSEAVQLKGVDFSLLGGDGVCDGRIMLSPALQLDLALRLAGVRWPLITGLAPNLTGEVRLVGGLDTLSLSGKATLKRTVYHRAVNLQRLVLEELLGPERERVEEGGAMALNLTVDVPGTLEVDTPLARVTLRGALRVVGTTARYGVLGRLEALPGGEMELAGVRYELDRGIVTFSNSERVEPRLDLLAHTTVQSFDITVGLLGTLDRLVPTFTSNPPLPDMDIVSLLSVGRRAEQAGQAQAGAVASSFLTEQLTGAVTSRARTLLDVDQLRVDPFAATQSGNPTARLTVVKQLSRGWTVTLSTNLASNREEIVTSRWRLGQGIYLEADRDVDGSYALDVKWQVRY
jgi:autotransporter translocation and assembly factor TamB